MKRVMTVSEAAELIKDNMSVMIGGFLKCGSPTEVIECLLKNGTKELTLIAPCLFGLEGIAGDELRRMGMENVRVEDRRVLFSGGLDAMAKA
ncbi:MAG: hypothetical protein IKY98_00835, partial [Alphaproteobacteria bacterium]|nr:hypothetical protein [Alphaproteobacteria bacterium]